MYDLLYELNMSGLDMAIKQLHMVINALHTRMKQRMKAY